MDIPALPFSRYTIKVPKPLGNKYIENPETVGDKIRNRRLEMGLSQKQVADILETFEESIFRWETNRNSPEMKHLPRIIKFLGYFPVAIDTSTIGGKLKEYRYNNGLNQEQLADTLGINESTVYHYEKNKHKPSTFVLRKLKNLSIIS